MMAVTILMQFGIALDVEGITLDEVSLVVQCHFEIPKPIIFREKAFQKKGNPPVITISSFGHAYSAVGTSPFDAWGDGNRDGEFLINF